MMSHTGWNRHRVQVTGGEVHVVEAGSPDAPTFVFLHGWPEDWSAFGPLMTLAQHTAHVLALDLPGIGESRMRRAPGDKWAIAEVIHEAVHALGLQNLTLVGHDAGGMVTYAYLRAFPHELKAAAILNTALPGLAPWDEVVRNPSIWHFAFHSVPELPERLVTGHIGEYFDFFYDAMTAAPEAIPEESRTRYVRAYSRPSALRTGFDWYRAFSRDAERNANPPEGALQVPVLYLRGEQEGGHLDRYLNGLRDSGLAEVTGAVIPGSGHFAPEEQPEAVWRALSSWANLPG